jgi:hypothetical protein
MTVSKRQSTGAGRTSSEERQRSLPSQTLRVIAELGVFYAAWLQQLQRVIAIYEGRQMWLRTPEYGDARGPSDEPIGSLMGSKWPP